ncbi:MAG: AMP-binding protein [Clostridia bacterium]|nr:AMP-binding protein [Clostridia bacterium]
MADSKAKSSKRNKDGYYITKPFTSIREMVYLAKEEAGDWDAYQYKISETEIAHVTYNEFYDTTENLGASLTEMGLGEAHIACVGDNSYPWIVAYLTVLKSAGVFVPVDRELPMEDMFRVINDSDSIALFYGARFEKLFLENRDKLPNIKYFIGLDREDAGEGMLSMKGLIEFCRYRSHDAAIRLCVGSTPV